MRQIATKLGVLDEEVISMNRRLAGPDASLNAPLRADGESEWQDWLADKDAVSQETQLAESEEKSIRMSLLEEAMTELTDRERHILTERRLKDDPTTLEELAAQYGVSRERVRQIEVRAFEKLQKAMRAAATSATSTRPERPRRPPSPAASARPAGSSKDRRRPLPAPAATELPSGVPVSDVLQFGGRRDERCVALRRAETLEFRRLHLQRAERLAGVHFDRADGRFGDADRLLDPLGRSRGRNVRAPLSRALVVAAVEAPPIGPDVADRLDPVARMQRRQLRAAAPGPGR